MKSHIILFISCDKFIFSFFNLLFSSFKSFNSLFLSNNVEFNKFKSPSYLIKSCFIVLIIFSLSKSFWESTLPLLNWLVNLFVKSSFCILRLLHNNCNFDKFSVLISKSLVKLSQFESKVFIFCFKMLFSFINKLFCSCNFLAFSFKERFSVSYVVDLCTSVFNLFIILFWLSLTPCNKLDKVVIFSDNVSISLFFVSNLFFKFIISPFNFSLFIFKLSFSLDNSVCISTIFLSFFSTRW